MKNKTCVVSPFHRPFGAFIMLTMTNYTNHNYNNNNDDNISITIILWKDLNPFTLHGLIWVVTSTCASGHAAENGPKWKKLVCDHQRERDWHVGRVCVCVGGGLLRGGEWQCKERQTEIRDLHSTPTRCSENQQRFCLTVILLHFHTSTLNTFDLGLGSNHSQALWRLSLLCRPGFN